MLEKGEYQPRYVTIKTLKSTLQTLHSTPLYKIQTAQTQLTYVNLFVYTFSLTARLAHNMYNHTKR